MSKSTILIVLSIILFVMGAWPIALVLLIIAVAAKEPVSATRKDLEQQVQELKEENEKLRQAADQKFVQDILDKTSGK